MYALTITALLVVAGLVVLVSWLHAWGAVGTWLMTQSVPTPAIGVPVLAAILVGLLSFAGIRRVGP